MPAFNFLILTKSRSEIIVIIITKKYCTAVNSTPIPIPTAGAVVMNYYSGWWMNGSSLWTPGGKRLKTWPGKSNGSPLSDWNWNWTGCPTCGTG